MEQITLRPEYPVEPTDPLSVAPNPRVMGQMYIGARKGHRDGMTLACATPRFPYEEVVDRYEHLHTAPGFSDLDFFNAHFDVNDPQEAAFIAPPGMGIDTYIKFIRPLFVFPNTDQGNFDIWLPYDRSVAGIGRFGLHSFLWDGFHMGKGYAADGRWDLVLNIADNMEYQINRFGYALNGSAYFYVTRSQPDYFAHLVRTVADRIGPEALIRYLPTMERNHMGYWMDGLEELSGMPDDGKVHTNRTLVRMPDGSFLNRYWDDGEGPRLESYKEDVETGKLATQGLHGALRERRLRKVYKDLRGAAASGWDFSSRWFRDGSSLATINTTDIAPCDLNSLLAYNEEMLAAAYEAAAQAGGYDSMTVEQCRDRAKMYREMHANRVAAINKYLWDPNTRIYRDYNFADRHQTGIISAAMTYPLYVGIANAEQSLGVADAIEQHLLYKGGIIATTTENSNEQWDGGVPGGKRSKNVWAPFNWSAVRGFARTAHLLTAREVDFSPATAERFLRLSETIKAAYMGGVETVFDHTRMTAEKHRGDHPEIPANGGEYALVKVLGMTGETYQALRNVDPRDAADHLLMGRLALAA
ncbi:MAG TPA: trehalase family glycosidase [Candidatus Saccharimonadales bacterium]|nr:trehalase family glycosidase [Candidatus Saccharimonadales bacterium]